jgi:cytochrome c oxidase subunit 4
LFFRVSVSTLLLVWLVRLGGTAEIRHALARADIAWLGLVAVLANADRVLMGVLAVLTLLEVGVAFMGFSRTATILALLGMAVWKALLVALYFMHLRFEPTAVRLVAAAPLVPAAILMLLVIFEW